MDFFESCYGLSPPLQYKEYVPSQRIKSLKLKTLAEQSLPKANKLLDEHSKDGKAINLAKLSKELKDCNPGDVRRAENIKELIEELSNGLITANEDIEQSRSKLFDELITFKYSFSEDWKMLYWEWFLHLQYFIREPFY